MKKLLAVVLSLALVMSLCIFADAEAGKTKEAAPVSGGIAKLADYLPKDVLESLSKDFKERENLDIEKKAGIVVSLEAINDPNNLSIDIYLLNNPFDDVATFAAREALDFGTLPAKVDLGDGKTECYVFFYLLNSAGAPAFTCTFMIGVDNKKVLVFDYLSDAIKVDIGSSGKTVIIPPGGEEGKSDRDNAIGCYNYSNADFPLEKVTIYEQDCKDFSQFEKIIVENYDKFNAVAMRIIPFDGGIATLVFYPDDGKTHSTEFAFCKDGKAYSVELDLKSSAESDITNPVLNSLRMGG